MTDFIIKAETFIRLSKAALQPDETHAKFNDTMRGVHISQSGGVAIAVATCGRILAGECLGDCGEDGSITITIDPRCLAIAEAEAVQDGSLHIVQTAGWTVVRGTHGSMLPINGEIAGEYPDWQAAIPQVMPSKSNGAFIFSGDMIARMGHTAPSGIFVLPKHVDFKAPVIVRDLHDENWFGMFLVTETGGTQSVGPAQLPEWLIK